MNKIRKYLLEDEISYKDLIIYSIICGIVTGIIPLIKILNDTSFHNISVCFEMWVFLALIVILKSKKPLDAAIKTFIFFLISQPLCYLVQVPFSKLGFSLFNYYPYWFKLTILTFPGAFLAWYVKKNNILSMIILSIGNFILSCELCEHFETLMTSFPHQLLAVLFIIFEVIFFINILFDVKLKRIILYIVFILIVILTVGINNYTNYINNKNSESFTISGVELENNNYTVKNYDAGISAYIMDNTLFCRGSKDGNYNIVIMNSNNEELNYLCEIKNNESTLYKTN